MKYYLAWQTHSNGTRHLRKYDQNGKFVMWEMQTYAALEWMEKNGNPTYPECERDNIGLLNMFIPKKPEPYETDEVKPDTVTEGMME